MSLFKFKRAVLIGQLPEKDREWFPRWFAGYAGEKKRGQEAIWKAG